MGEKPGFFRHRPRVIPGKKAGFLFRANIENLWLGTYHVGFHMYAIASLIFVGIAMFVAVG
ncbi:Uncharacterized protein dnm_095180 [Desulfonema magnum]|uniref:Uncharacterized protein n=1 Tax=Desulfonema magnum TaxID=45655 RepID=A0A975GTW5_9BACT|nr:Uncharacterized protein dnm_095180 [Desulfonema magnum]